MISGFFEYKYSEEKPLTAVEVRVWQHEFCESLVSMEFVDRVKVSVKTGGNQVAVSLHANDLVDASSSSYGCQMTSVSLDIESATKLATDLVKAFESALDFDMPTVPALKQIYSDFFEGMEWEESAS